MQKNTKKPLNKRQLSAIETKSKIIKATIELLKEKGLNSINVEEITQKAGVAKGSFYTYFKHKEDVIAQYGRESFGEIKDEINKLNKADIIQKLAHYCYRFMECVESCGINVCREWTSDTVSNKDGQKWQYDFEMLKNILETAIKDKELKENTPIELLTHLLISQLYGMMTCWCISDGIFEPLDWTHKFCNIQLKPIFETYLIKEQKI